MMFSFKSNKLFYWIYYLIKYLSLLYCLLSGSKNHLNPFLAELVKMKNRRFLTAADASQSVVSGPGIANVAAGTNNTVIVTAKSSGGGTISTGGDIFASRITNRWTKYNQYYCKPTGASGPISGTLMTPFGDLNNGNYSIYYHIGNTGKLNISKINYRCNIGSSLPSWARKSLSWILFWKFCRIIFIKLISEWIKF